MRKLVLVLALVAIFAPTAAVARVTAVPVSLPRHVPTVPTVALYTLTSELTAHEAALFAAWLQAIWDAEQARLEAERAAVLAAAANRARSAPSVAQNGTRACGSGTIPAVLPAAPNIGDAVVQRESGFTLDARNCSSSASGKYQFLDSTWNGYGGYASAADAPESVQDAKAAEMNPCHWQAPNYCR